MKEISLDMVVLYHVQTVAINLLVIVILIAKEVMIMTVIVKDAKKIKFKEQIKNNRLDEWFEGDDEDE